MPRAERLCSPYQITARAYRPKKTDTILTKATSGYGLKNINERIKLRFGEEYGLRLTSPRSPTVFTITLPLIPLEPQ